MPQFVREEQITNLAPGAHSLAELASVFRHRARSLDTSAPDRDRSDNGTRPIYTISSLDQVHKVFSPELLSRRFLEAEAVEKVTFRFETMESLRTNRERGEYLELSLEEKDPGECYLAVGADNKTWADDSFTAVQDVLDKCKAEDDMARKLCSRRGLEVLGCALGLGISLWVATAVSPMLPAPNAFSLSFFFTLLVFTTTWMIVEPHRHLSALAFPNIKFRGKSKPRLPGLMQAFAGARAPLS